MSTDWLGISLSIPIGIGTALVTPWFQRRLEERGKQRALVESRHAQAELQEVSHYRDHPHQFTQYLIHVAIKTTFIGAIMGVFSGVSFVVGQLLATRGFENQTFSSVFYVGGQFVALLGSVIIVNICRPALIIWTRVKNYDEYAAAAREVIASGASH